MSGIGTKSSSLFSALICLALLLSVVALPAAASSPGSTLVDTDWLADNLSSDDLVIVDVRLPEEFSVGHIEGAVNIPFTKFFGAFLMAPKMDEVRQMFGEAGISNTSRVVVYDDGSFMLAARMFWLLEVYGHEQAALLNVGFDHWEEGKLPISVDPITPTPATFVPSVQPNRLATKLSTRLAIDNPDLTIIDARSIDEYEGRVSTAFRFGHIPSAKAFPWSDNYAISDDRAKMKPVSALEEVYGDLDKSKPIIAHCNGGAQAALNYVVLRTLGFDVAVYDGSWVEWGNDLSLPVINPSAQ
ncbi:MAG: sulfurtransferase [Magnetovibrionaceae bacterium]